MRQEPISDVAPTPGYDLVLAQIDRLSRRFQRLTLPEPLEKGFEADLAPGRAARLWIEGLVIICLFVVFAVADYFIRPDHSFFSLRIRLCIITPLALLLNASMRFNPGRIYRESIIAAAGCGFGLIHLYVEGEKGVASSAYAQIGIIFAVIFMNVVIRLQFRFAIGASAGLFLGDLIFLHHNRFLGPSEKNLGATLTIISILMTVLANYSISHEERLGYLVRLRNEMQRRELSSANEKLQHMSTMDSLTGLANRHSYELEFQRMWCEAIEAGASLSAIVIDIDCFKAVNDTRGHLYGDRVLMRVASLVVQALRGKNDLAARFGGEEFVVLLPAQTKEVAMMVAERIRKLVEVAGSPALHDSGSHPALTTVSCGVASCKPDETYDREELLQAADMALYQAKRTGRNRVCCGEVRTTPHHRGPSSREWSPPRSIPTDSAAIYDLA